MVESGWLFGMSCIKGKEGGGGGQLMDAGGSIGGDGSTREGGEGM